MKRIGIISDSHSSIDEKALGHLAQCDEIWHAGDVGRESVLEKLENICRLRAVYGNIDDHRVRSILPETQVFEVEGKKVLIHHIAGYPGRYNAKVKKLISLNKPDIVVCGHSHILKVIYDKALNHLHINPGAVGNSGFHRIKTIVRLNLDKGEISNMDVVEMKR